ncbi:MAG TPA: hypothetical protein VJS20_07700, partial [Gemmatimonadales bacterium]|nr:hypothetical protein [Gemmatimonadales bacterium]
MKLTSLLAFLLPAFGAPQERHEMTWNPGAKKVVATHVLITGTEAVEGGREYSIEARTELKPLAEASPMGAEFAVSVYAYKYRSRRGKDREELTIEAGKNPDFGSGEATRELRKLAGELEQEQRVTITTIGKSTCGGMDDSPVLQAYRGIVEPQLPMRPVTVGGTWASDIRLSFPVENSIGSLKGALVETVSTPRGTVARIKMTV